MASEQIARRENTTDEREVAIEKDRVPKMASHFEALAEKAIESDITGGKDTPLETGKEGGHGGKAIGEVGVGGKGRETHETGSRFESLADKVKDFEGHEEQQQRHERSIGGHEGRDIGSYTVGKFEVTGREERPFGESKVSAEMTGKQGYIEESKKSSEEAIREAEESHARAQQWADKIAAEERYAQAKQERESHEEGTEKAGQRKTHGEGTERESQEHVQERKQEGAIEGTTVQSTAEKGSTVKDTALEKGQQGYEAAKETAGEYAAQGTDYAVTKSSEVQNETLPAVQEKAAAAKDTAVDITKKVASFTGEKAVVAKDVAVDTGKTAAGYAGKVAVDVKDKAVAAGWTAVHYSADKAVESTKAAARVVQGVAGYTAEKAAAAGHVAADLATKPISAAKDVAISTGETLKDFTARKKEESERHNEAKISPEKQETGEVQEREIDTGKQDVETKAEQKLPVSEEEEWFEKAVPEEHGREMKESGEMEASVAGAMLGAIGETLVEIAQTTKDLVAGPQRGEVDQAVGGYESKTMESKTEHQ